MIRTFGVDAPLDPPVLLARARRVAAENGAVLVGDEASGRFSHGLIKGEYRVQGRTVVATITRKHWTLPWPLVEAQLRRLVAPEV